MAILFSDWRYDGDYLLFITRYGIDNRKLFVELSSRPNSTTDRVYKHPIIIEGLISKVNTLCIKGGGRYDYEDAKELLKTYRRQ